MKYPISAIYGRVASEIMPIPPITDPECIIEKCQARPAFHALMLPRKNAFSALIEATFTGKKGKPAPARIL
jgi:hypothetical protein